MSNLTTDYVALKYLKDIMDADAKDIKKSYSEFYSDNYASLVDDSINTVFKGNLLSSIDTVEAGETVKIGNSSNSYLMKSADDVYVSFKAFPKKTYTLNETEDDLIADGYYKDSAYSMSYIKDLVKDTLKKNQITQKSFFEKSFPEQKEILDALEDNTYLNLLEYYDVTSNVDFTFKRLKKDEKIALINESIFSDLYKLSTLDSGSSQYRLASIQSVLNVVNTEMLKLDKDTLLNVYDEDNQYLNKKDSFSFILKDDAEYSPVFTKRVVDEKSVPFEKKELDSTDVQVSIYNASEKISDIISSIDIAENFSKSQNHKRAL